MSTAVTVSKVEELTLSIMEEIHVKATPGATFEALLEQLGPVSYTHLTLPTILRV